MRRKRRAKQRWAFMALAAFLAVSVFAAIALTRSTTPRPEVSADVAVPPENEALEHRAGQLAPDESLDFKQASASEVTEAQVKRAQAQAALVAPAAGGIAWRQLGPYNIG